MRVGMQTEEGALVCHLLGVIKHDLPGAEEAHFTLVEIKQDLVNDEEYEVLKDWRSLEKAYQVDLPFKMNT